MYTHVEKPKENTVPASREESQSVASVASQSQYRSESTFQFADNRPEAITQRKRQDMANNNPQVNRSAQLQALANNYSIQQQRPIQKKENNTGLPGNLKAGIENLSGYSMDDVKVHYNSDKPAQLQAHAFAQGTDIHLAPEQEKYLFHESWHVVQQKQGRVKPTMHLKESVNVNDDIELEREADVMGSKALLMKSAVNDKNENENTHTQKQSNNPRNIHHHKTETQQDKLKQLTSKSPPFVQRKMIDNTTGYELENSGGTKTKYRAAKMALLESTAAKDWLGILDQRLVGKEEVFAKFQEEIDGDSIRTKIDFRELERPKGLNERAPTPIEARPMYPYTFVVEAVSKMEPNPDNFAVVNPGNAKVEKINDKTQIKAIPDNEGDKPIGYVANIASYYDEPGVKGIAPKYYNDAISGNDDEKGNRLAVVAGLNSFEPVTSKAYYQTRNKLRTAVADFEMPALTANVSAFSFFWKPKWEYKGSEISLEKLRLGLSHYEDTSGIISSFIKRQNGFKEHLPYGIFRETVTASHQTKSFVNRLSAYNDPVYIHSGDGDAISLKITSGDGPGLSNKGVLDKFSEEIGGKEHNPMLAIGGYNFFKINEHTVKTEIVKTDETITHYSDESRIDKTGSIDIERLKVADANFVALRAAQIIHNSQVVNRWDQLIRGAIGKVYPKMLYPTEPNMLIKAHESRDEGDFDLFSHEKFKDSGDLKDEHRGTLWGNTASEGRALRENLESMYASEATDSGLTFVEWIEQASLPTETRGFARHFLVSGYEKFPDTLDESSWPPVYHPATLEKRNKPIPLVDAAAQQAQSYTSAARLTDMFCRASGQGKESKEGLQARTIFNEIELITKRLMSGETTDINLEQGPGFPGLIVKQIKSDFLDRFGVD